MSPCTSPSITTDSALIEAVTLPLGPIVTVAAHSSSPSIEPSTCTFFWSFSEPVNDELWSKYVDAGGGASGEGRASPADNAGGVAWRLNMSRHRRHPEAP